jgi:hypothetical protein
VPVTSIRVASFVRTEFIAPVEELTIASSITKEIGHAVIN